MITSITVKACKCSSHTYCTYCHTTATNKNNLAGQIQANKMWRKEKGHSIGMRWKSEGWEWGAGLNGAKLIFICGLL